MKMTKRFNKKLTTQFSIFSIWVFVIMAVFISTLVFYQNEQLKDFHSVTEQLEKKEQLALEMKSAFNLAISEMRAYYAFGGKDYYYQEAMNQKDTATRAMAEFQVISNTPQDLALNNQARNFYTYYFNDVLPTTKEAFDNNSLDLTTQSDTIQSGSGNVRTFQRSMKKYTNQLAKEQTNSLNSYAQQTLKTRVIFGIIFMLLLLFLGQLLRVQIRKIKEPLGQLTEAATKISEGEFVPFVDNTQRSDELGLLSQAFQNMSTSIMENEEELQAQNEELLAQQETLQVQQVDLEEALSTMSVREDELKIRNEFVHGLSNSLDKTKVLHSVVHTVARILQSDKGMIALLDSKIEYASLGISQEGIKQFLEFFDTTLLVKLKETKKSYSNKRESLPSEKGYHIEKTYSYDVYSPIVSGSGEILGVMAYTRYNKPFLADELLQVDSFSKQIAISMDNLNLFEQTEEERILNQQILDNIKEGIQLIDNEGTIVSHNREVADIFGWNASDMLHKKGKEWIEHLAHTVKDPVKLKESFEHILTNKKKAECHPFVYTQTAPTKRVIQVYCEPLMQNNEKIGTVIVHRDITKEHEVDAMKSEFVSTVSHELRTPLASVLGFTELMLNRELKPEKQKKYLTTIYQEANRLTGLINDFLDVQRMESGSQTYTKKYKDVREIIQQIVDTYEVNLLDHEIQLLVETANTVVFADTDKLQQVFTNLISNAIKYSPKGGTIKIRLFEENACLRISFKDEGLGIPPEGLDKVFSKFYRVDNSDRRKIGGTGLGLSIVKEIVKAHQGDIQVESVLGEGSTFVVSFPLLKSIEGYRKKSEGAETEYDETKKSVRVTVVEDDVSHANLLRTELEESGFQVDVFENAESALEFIRDHQPDVLVLDLQLGKDRMTGWELIEIVKKDEVLKSIPILISSASDEKEKAQSLGASDYLIKPYPTSKLPQFILHTLLAENKEGKRKIPTEKIIWDSSHENRDV